MAHPTGFEPVEVLFLAKLCQAMPIKSISYVGSVWHTLFKGAQTGAQLLFFFIDLAVVFNDRFELAGVAFVGGIATYPSVFQISYLEPPYVSVSLMVNVHV